MPAELIRNSSMFNLNPLTLGSHVARLKTDTFPESSNVRLLQQPKGNTISSRFGFKLGRIAQKGESIANQYELPTDRPATVDEVEHCNHSFVQVLFRNGD